MRDSLRMVKGNNRDLDTLVDGQAALVRLSKIQSIAVHLNIFALSLALRQLGAFTVNHEMDCGAGQELHG